jgi:hypothetical protein
MSDTEDFLQLTQYITIKAFLQLHTHQTYTCKPTKCRIKNGMEDN